MEKVVQGEQDVLALLLACEMGHVVLGHRLADEKADHVPTPEQRRAADRAGAELLLRAGFSYRRGTRARVRLQDLLPERPRTHTPTVKTLDPGERLTLLDRDSVRLWCRMPAFGDGFLLLALEHYALAESCFEQVVREFPGCAEAWAALGQARLMHYCDNLPLDDLREYGLGPLACGGFLRRLPSLEPPVRVKMSRLWWRAVEALHEGLRQKPDQPLARMCLGLASLIHPDGKDVEEAAQTPEAGRRLHGDARSGRSHHAHDQPRRRLSSLRPVHGGAGAVRPCRRDASENSPSKGGRQGRMAGGRPDVASSGMRKRRHRKDEGGCSICSRRI